MLVSKTIVKIYRIGDFSIYETFRYFKTHVEKNETDMKFTILYENETLLCDVSIEELGNLKELIEEVL